ncbi:MAG: hypothetical protein ABSH36_07370, partial [Solirubrobacteraceae bacterium]|jgi:hypothetical protein
MAIVHQTLSRERPALAKPAAEEVDLHTAAAEAVLEPEELNPAFEALLHPKLPPRTTAKNRVVPRKLRR